MPPLSPSVLDVEEQRASTPGILDPLPRPTPQPAPQVAGPGRFRRFGDSAQTRTRIFDNALKAAQEIEEVSNPRHSLGVSDVHWTGPETYSIADQKQALLSRGTLDRRLMGTVTLKDAEGHPIAARKIGLARVPYLTDRGTFIMNGNEYTMCLHRSVKVWTERGMLPISEIVEKRLGIRVWSYDFASQKFVLRPVVGWYKNPVRDVMGCATFQDAARMNGAFPRFTTKTLWATPGHNVYDIDGNKSPICDAQELTAVEEQLSYTQEQLLYGTLLGDGHVRPDGIYQCIHGRPQHDYAVLKREIMSTVTTEEAHVVTRTRRGRKNQSVRFLTRVHSAFHAARNLCYVGHRKVVSQALLDRVDEMGLAFWFGDDGDARYTRGTNHVVAGFHTQSFSAAEIQVLRDWLHDRWGLATYTEQATKYAGRDRGWIIRLSGKHAEHLLDIVAPYLPPVLHYKLLERPHTRVCSCGQEIKPVRQFCNTCLLRRARQSGLKFDKSARQRFGDTATIRQLLIADTPVEEIGTECWEARIATAGSAIPAMQADVQLRYALCCVPCEWQENRGRRYEQARHAYDIQVDGTHNYVANGILVSNSHQMRLRPGVFTRRKQNGELESHVNVSKGYGHRIFLDPESGVFRIQMGQAKIPLLPLLHAMGVPDRAVREAWGNELAAVNMEKADPQAIGKLYKKLYRHDDANELEQKAAVAKAFTEMELDPEVTKRTLGGEHRNVGPDTLMAITQKLLRVARGEEEPDDRDALAYQTMMGPEDLFAERLRKAKAVTRQMLWKASGRGSLDSLTANPYGDAIQAALMSSGLGMPIEEINPADIFDQQVRVTRMGEGGIPSLDAIPDEARAVQPSQFGFVDFLRTPECYDRLTEVMTRRGWVYWPDVREDDEFACLVAGRLEYHTPERLIREQYTGPMYGADTGRVAYLVTPNHRLWVSPMFKGAQYRVETADVCHGSFRRVCSGGFGEYIGHEEVQDFGLPQVERRSNNEAVVLDRIPIGPWAELVGWWLGEGSCTYQEQGAYYAIKLSQSRTANPSNCDRIAATLAELPFKWCYSDRAFVLATKQLAAYFRQFGGSHERYIPAYLLDAPLAARRRLYEALLLGEGRRDRRGVRTQFCTTSNQLADDFVRLAFSLGYATRKVWEPDDREQSNYGGAWVVHVHNHNEHQLLPNGRRGNDYYTVDFDDEVFCATVPGGLLYVRRGDTVGHWSGNSGKVGVDSRMARGAVKGEDGRIYMPVRDARGQTVYKSPQDLADAAVAFPNELARGEPFVAALVGGKPRMVPREKVDYEVPDMESTFSPLGNMIPFKSQVKGQRAVMAARMLTQALPLKGAEAPLVQSGIPGQEGRSFEDEYATHMGALRSDASGRVVAVDPVHGITIAKRDGTTSTFPLYENFPFNRKTFIHQTPVVQSGQQVSEGQLLARSNFTDEHGTTALGRNARVAYIPWRGLNFEDANVISQSFAQKMSSEHMYQNQHEWEKGDHQGRNAFVSIFPSKYDRKTLENFDKEGVIKPGTEVKQGDPLILIAHERERNKKSMLRGGKPSYRDVSQTWEHEQDGVVTDVVHTPKGVAVVVKSTMPMQVGDKLSGRYGDKGIIARIIPDDEMPKDRDGNPFEVLLNPLGIQSRTNPAQIVEAALGKIAAMRGKPFKVPDFQDEDDLIEFALKELQQAGLPDIESVVDPSNDRRIDDIFTGNRWFMKLHHTAESKAQGRGLGAYTAEGTPAKGGTEGAKRVGMLETNALLSHGATEVVREGSLVRGQSAPQYWAQYMSGFKPPTPRVPHVYEKFVNHLKASGINVVREGQKMHIMAMTDKDINSMAGDRELKNVETVNWKNMEPVKGGLFDPELTGGHQSMEGGGNRWSFIRLSEPLPNPVMEEPIRRLLGLTAKNFEDIIGGQRELNGQTGPRAISHALQTLNLDKEIERAREEIKSGKRTLRDAAVRRLGYLRSSQRLGIHPKDWVLSKAPVLPPAFRPVSTMGNKRLPLVADPNYLYKELWDANQALRDMSAQVEDGELGDERLAAYRAFKAVTGLGDPTHPKNQERKVKGILRHVFGNSPKLGTVQRRLLGSTTDFVGRSVIAPDPDLDMDQVGIPETQAWTIYHPAIIRRLVRRGMSRQQAARAAEDRSSPARQALLQEMESGVVVINRAPTLHRYGMMAARPRLTKGDVLRVSPLVVGGFGADFDGDAMQYHVPMTDEAQDEAAEKMLPSRNLFAASNFQVHYKPTQEYVGGLYEATAREDNNKPMTFATVADAIRAYQQGRIGIGRKVEILER